MWIKNSALLVRELVAPQYIPENSTVTCVVKFLSVYTVVKNYCWHKGKKKQDLKRREKNEGTLDKAKAPYLLLVYQQNVIFKKCTRCGNAPSVNNCMAGSQGGTPHNSLYGEAPPRKG